MPFRQLESNVTHTTLVEAKCNCSTSAPARPMAVGNMHQRGYPSHSMTGRHDSVMSICLTCHVYTSSCHKSDETFSTAVLCVRSISNAYHDLERCPFRQWASEAGSIIPYSERALAHTILPTCNPVISIYEESLKSKVELTIYCKANKLSESPG